MARKVLYQVAMANEYRKTFIHVKAVSPEAAIAEAKADPSNGAYDRFQARVSRYA